MIHDQDEFRFYTRFPDRMKCQYLRYVWPNSSRDFIFSVTASASRSSVFAHAHEG